MYPAVIRDYFRPTSVAEARELYAQCDGETVFIAGGMSLMQAIKSRLVNPDCVIDLNGIEDLAGICIDGEALCIGAMTRYRTIAERAAELGPFEILADAAAHVGDRQVRNRGTIGGSLAWNYIAACTPIAALAAGARIRILRTGGERDSVPIEQFLIAPLTTALEEGDLLLAVELAPARAAAGSAYRKWGIVRDALPVIGVGVYLELASARRCRAARFAVGGLPAGPQLSPAAARALTAADLDDPGAPAACARAGAAELETADDPWIGADYKTHLIEQLGREVIADALARARRRL